jgi:autonomous glycyl radical cofactor GrcA
MSTEERRKLVLPDRRKNTYADLERRIDDHANHIEDRLSRWLRLGLVAFAIIGVVCTISLVGFGIVLREVQNQRHEACTNQNGRHDRTLTLFRAAASDAIKRDPERAPEIRRSINTNVAIINALAPKQNCDVIAPKGDFFP